MTTPTSDSAPANPSLAWLAPFLLLIAGAAVYSNSMDAPFIFDGTTRIEHNPVIRNLWSLNWLTYSQRPVPMFTFAVNYAVHRLDLWGYHVLNLAIHIGASWALFEILRRTFKMPRLQPRFGPYAEWLALAAALLWLVHPLQTQSVTYTIQRMESLMGLFYLLTLLLFIISRQARNPAVMLFLSVVCCYWGIGTKEVMVTAPLMVLWYDRVFAAESWRQIWTQRRIYYAGLFSSWILLGVLMTLLSNYGGNAIVVEGVSPADYALTQPGVILHYVFLVFWPAGLCLDYYWPVADGFGEIVPPLLAVLALLGLTAWLLPRRPALALLGGWFFLILAPTSSVVPLTDLAFEHRMYLPLAAICVLVVLLGFWLWKLISQSWAPTAATVAVLAIYVAMVGALGWRTFDRNRDYRSLESAWSSVLEVSPNNPRAHTSLGMDLLNHGRVDEAERHFHDALKTDPEFGLAHYNIGRVFVQRGKNSQALPYFENSVNMEMKQIYKTWAREYIGWILLQEQRYAESVDYLQDAVQRQPAKYQLRHNLALALMELGRGQEAADQWENVLKQNREFTPSRLELANWHREQARRLTEQGEYDKAITHYLQWIKLYPTDVQANREYGVLLLDRFGKRELALRYFRTALNTDPNDEQLRQDFLRAVQTKPEDDS